jgi:hypothetical protein
MICMEQVLLKLIKGRVFFQMPRGLKNCRSRSAMKPGPRQRSGSHTTRL